MMLFANLKDPWEGRTRQGLPTLGNSLGISHRFTYNYSGVNGSVAMNADDLVSTG
jgi:hypothetical protein